MEDGIMFAKDIGIDLGTANVLIYIKGVRNIMYLIDPFLFKAIWN